MWWRHQFTQASHLLAYGFSSHIRCKACHCLRATSNCKAPRKPPRTDVCLGLRGRGKTQEDSKPLGPWSLIVAPGQMNDSGHAWGATLAHGWFLLPPSRWQHHLCVAVIWSVINRHVSIAQQFWNVLLRCSSQQNVKTQMLFPQKVSLKNGYRGYQNTSFPMSCSQKPPFSTLDQLQASSSLADKGPCQSLQGWSGRQVPCDPHGFLPPIKEDVN